MSTQRINLIPPEFSVGEKALIETGLRRKAIIAGALLVALLTAHYFYVRVSFIALDQEVDSLDRKMAETTALSDAVQKSKEALDSQLKNLERRSNSLMGKQVLLQKLGAERFKWSEALDRFHKGIPADVWVDELVLDEQSSDVKGGTFSNESVGEFINGLNRSQFFANATFVKTEAGTINEKPVIMYELSFDLVTNKKA